MKIKIYETIKSIFKKYRGEKENDIDYQNAISIIKNDSNSILLDVRSPQEYKEGHLENSINIPLYDLDKEQTIIVYCQSGNRSRKAIEILKKKGYKNLYNIAGGLDSI